MLLYINNASVQYSVVSYIVEAPLFCFQCLIRRYYSDNSKEEGEQELNVGDQTWLCCCVNRIIQTRVL